MMIKSDLGPFEKWWYNYGSGIVPLPQHDHEEHAKRVSAIAFEAGASQEKIKARDDHP